MNKRLPIRIAIRDEGDLVNVYLAETHGMKDALLLASVHQKAAHLPGVREKIIELGQSIVSAMIEETTGSVPEFVQEKPPEHERTGRA